MANPNKVISVTRLRERANLTILVCVLVLVFINFYSSPLLAAAPSATDISYQGFLKNAGNAANGNFDFEFTLWDAELNGSQVGAPIMLEDVPVIDGIFQVELDFGAPAFDGTLRWLKIQVALANNGLTTLNPRQRVTAAPVSVYALQSPGGGGGGTLDAAYDFGGPGVGREIQADAGEVHILGPDGLRSNGGFASENVLLGHQFGSFDVEAYQSFTINGPPAPATAGARIREGSLQNPIFKWAHFRVAPNYNAIRRQSGSSLRFQTEDSPNDPVFFLTQMVLNADGDLGLGTLGPVSRFQITGGSDATMGGGGYFVIGDADNTNLIMDDNELHARDNGSVSRLALNNDGGNVTVAAGGNGNLGIGFNDPQVRVHIQGFSDVSVNTPTSGGFVLGSTGSTNLAMDNNEIMARSGGAVSTLYLNNDGGVVETGSDLLVGGDLDIGYQVVESSVGDATSHQVNCPAGKRVMAGGCAGGPLITSYPLSNGSGWFCARDDSGGIVARAICARFD